MLQRTALALACLSAPAANATVMDLGLGNGGWMVRSYDASGATLASAPSLAGNTITNNGVPFWTATYTFSVGELSAMQLRIADFSAIDRAVFFGFGSKSVGIFGGDASVGHVQGRFLFSPTGYVWNWGFEANGATGGVVGAISPGPQTLTIFVNTTGSGIFGDVLTAGPSGLTFDASLELSPLPSVPEPASWALMILGFGLVGATLRRSRVPA